MKTLEVTISITIQIKDTGDKTYDCLAALDAAKAAINHRPSYELLRDHRDPSHFGAPTVRITKIKRDVRGGIRDGDMERPPLNIDTPIE